MLRVRYDPGQKVRDRGEGQLPVSTARSLELGMETVRVAIASNDGTTLAHSHMGDATSFLVYDISRGAAPVRIAVRDNTVRHMGHAGSGKMGSVARILDDVDVFVSGRMSPNFKKLAAQTRFQPVVVRTEQIDEVLKLLVGSFDAVAHLVAARRRGERPQTVLRLPDEGSATSLG